MRRALKTALWLGFAGCIPSFGQFTPFATPTAAYTASTTMIPITAANGTSMTSLSDGTLTVALSSPFSAQTVPNGGWGTWGSPPNTESSTPRVLANITSLTSATLTLSSPCGTFGFEIEPDLYGTYPVTASFYHGATLLGTVSQNIAGGSGALLAAGASSAIITSVVVTIPAAAQGFAMAQFRYGNAFIPGAQTTATVPTLSPAAWGALGLLLAGAGSLLARRARGSAGA